ncbi:MAG TPA: imidazolonepropionase [Caulobacterales bacterium]|nr:imidazolonepropionase [Caulobacterales bacterium]
MWDTLWLDAQVATMAAGEPYGLVADGVVAAKDGRIAWVGARANLPGAPEALAREVRPCGGALITPGLIDCHTHLVFGGDRALEFELRLEGATYEDIARAGGGILSTVNATRAASLDDLILSAAQRLRRMKAEGLTTVEIKSGYGLDLETEYKQLRAATALAEREGVRVRRTFLGLHALPPEFRDDRAAYVQLVADVMLPALAASGVIDAVDAYCDAIAFTPEEVDYFFSAARASGVPVKLHAEQLSNQGGGALAARAQALSADHLEWLDEDGVASMAAARTAAVLLPGAFYFLRDAKLPPIEALRAAGVPIAVATDCNPGTSPLTSPLLAMQMACTLFRLTPEEALAGMTRNAALALGLGQETGTIEPNKAADLAIWNVREPAELCYWIGADLLRERVFAGEVSP